MTRGVSKKKTWRIRLVGHDGIRHAVGHVLPSQLRATNAVRFYQRNAGPLLAAVELWAREPGTRDWHLENTTPVTAAAGP